MLVVIGTSFDRPNLFITDGWEGTSDGVLLFVRARFCARNCTLCMACRVHATVSLRGTRRSRLVYNILVWSVWASMCGSLVPKSAVLAIGLWSIVWMYVWTECEVFWTTSTFERNAPVSVRELTGVQKPQLLKHSIWATLLLSYSLT